MGFDVAWFISLSHWNRRWSGDKKKSVLTPTLSSEERETLFPRHVNLSALRLRWCRGSMRRWCQTIAFPHFHLPGAA